MITITKQNDGVLFEFEDSKKYLYGNGSILVPFNTLSIVADESDMITLKKAASNDVFLSARYDTDFGYRSKDDAIDDLKDLLFAETGGGGGGGVTSGQVQSMIDSSISGKADTSAVTAVDNALSAYSATTDARLAEDEEVTAAALNNLDENKQDALEYYSEDTSSESATIKVQNDDGAGNLTENRVFVDGGDIIIESYNETDDGEGNTGTTDTQVDINSLGLSIIASSDDGIDTTQTELEVQPMGAYINSEPIATEPYVDAATSGKVNTSAITTAITSGSTDDEIPTAKATYDAIQAGGGGSANVIELTQAQYDALTTIDPDAIYVITDATAYDPSTKVDTSAITTSITSSSTNSEVAGAKAVYDAIQSGGGATYSAGTNISIANDTINCTLPIESRNYNILGTNKSLYLTSNNISDFNPISNSDYFHSNIIVGDNSSSEYKYYLTNSIIVGGNSYSGTTESYQSGKGGGIICGVGNKIKKSRVFSAFGKSNSGITNDYLDPLFVFGTCNETKNANEAGLCQFNNSVSGSTTFGNSGNTLFTIGNGSGSPYNASTAVRHNALEIRQNGDLFFADTDNTTYQNYYQKPMVRLQDMYAALGGLKFVQCTQAEYDALVSGGTVDSSTIYFITNVVS